MKMTLQGTNLDLTDAIREYINKKLVEIERFIPDEMKSELHIEVERTTNHHRKGEVFRVEGNIVVPGSLLRAESKEDDLYKAIDNLKDELHRELKRYKETHRAKQRKQGRAFKEEQRLKD